MTTDGKYIYGFISTNEPKKLGPHGVDEKEVYFFPYEDIAAVVSDYHNKQFDLLPKETLLRNLAAYQAVIEKVMKDSQIIPVKFGTTVQGEEELKRILEKGCAQITSNLKEMKNKIELDVAALWSDLNAVLREIGEKDEQIIRLKQEAASMPPDKLLQFKINVGKHVKEAMDNRKEECASLILDVLKREAEDHCDHPIMDDSMIMNTAFLINKEKQEIFEEKVAQLDRHYQDRIKFRIVGPVPPYSFGTFEIIKADFGEVEKAREMLGLGEESTPMEIKETYWELTKRFHPDKFQGQEEAQKKFENISKAYQVLTGYCLGERCSFREKDVRAWIGLRPVKHDRALV
jgi:hypothetical protein